MEVPSNPVSHFPGLCSPKAKLLLLLPQSDLDTCVWRSMDHGQTYVILKYQDLAESILPLRLPQFWKASRGS